MRDRDETIVKLPENQSSAALALAPDGSTPPDLKLKLEYRKLAIDRAKLTLERDKLRLETRKFENEAHHRRATQTNQYATIAIRNVVLINGAAAIATLTYLGNVAKNSSTGTNSSAFIGASPFVVGVFTASVCTILAYGARLSYKGIGPKPTKSKLIETISWVFGVIALFCFPIGAYNMSKAIDTQIGRPDALYLPKIVEMTLLGQSIDLTQYSITAPANHSTKRYSYPNQN